jgi:hypothetical protein
LDPRPPFQERSPLLCASLLAPAFASTSICYKGAEPDTTRGSWQAQARPENRLHWGLIACFVQRSSITTGSSSTTSWYTSARFATCSAARIELSEKDYWEHYLGFDDVGAFRAILADAGRSVGESRLHELLEAKRPHYLARARTMLRAFGRSRLVRERARVGPVASCRALCVTKSRSGSSCWA